MKTALALVLLGSSMTTFAASNLLEEILEKKHYVLVAEDNHPVRHNGTIIFEVEPCAKEIEVKIVKHLDMVKNKLIERPAADFGRHNVKIPVDYINQEILSSKGNNEDLSMGLGGIGAVSYEKVSSDHNTVTTSYWGYSFEVFLGIRTSKKIPYSHEGYKIVRTVDGFNISGLDSWSQAFSCTYAEK